MAMFHDVFNMGSTAAQQVAIGAASAASSAFGAQTYYLRLCFTGTVGQACHYLISDGTPTALSTSTLLPSNWVEYVKCNPGQKIAVIQDGTTTGNLNVTEIW